MTARLLEGPPGEGVLMCLKIKGKDTSMLGQASRVGNRELKQPSILLAITLYLVQALIVLQSN